LLEVTVISYLHPARLLVLFYALSSVSSAQQSPPVPSDPLELVPVVAQPVQDVNQRAEIFNLLGNSHRISNVRSRPYDLKTTFIASGSSSSNGKWQLEDNSPGLGLYRWTAAGPNYSAVHLHVNRVQYSDQATDALPLRLVQAREAIFYSEPMLGPYASLRTASANLDGVDLTCALIAHNGTQATASDGRHWDEEEYCVDPKAGTLVTASVVPGLYVHYDYSKALQFHDRLIWNGFIITQAGHTVIEAQTESVSDPVNNPAAFQPAGLNQLGVGPIMNGPGRSYMTVPSSSSATQFVVLHGMQSPDGKLTEVELLASSDPAFTESALAQVTKGLTRFAGGPSTQPGATPQSHEILMTVQSGKPRGALFNSAR
jgi:hypothetical protein